MIWHVNTTMEYFFFKYQESKKCNLYSVSNKNMPGTRERLRKGLKILIEGQLTDGHDGLTDERTKGRTDDGLIIPLWGHFVFDPPPPQKKKKKKKIYIFCVF